MPSASIQGHGCLIRAYWTRSEVVPFSKTRMNWNFDAV